MFEKKYRIIFFDSVLQRTESFQQKIFKTTLFPWINFFHGTFGKKILFKPHQSWMFKSNEVPVHIKSLGKLSLLFHREIKMNFYYPRDVRSSRLKVKKK